MRPNFMEKRIFRKGEALGELIVRPFQTFASRQASAGILLLIVTGAAVVWINSSLGNYYEQLWHTHFRLEFGSYVFDRSLHSWINDGLMTIFFFVVGLEIKRELFVGELSSFRQAALPVSAALGGMVVPALIYYSMNADTPAAVGWGIPMATDIAFALAALTVLGSRVPHSLKVFLVAVAIADDLGAVLIIAVFYVSHISLYYLAISVIIFLSLVCINVLGFRRPLPYVALGSLLWLTVSLAGIHPTLAGVLVATTIPARSRCDTDTFLDRAGRVLNEFDCAGSCGFSVYTNADHQDAVRTLEKMCHNVEPPLQRIEFALHPWVAFLIMPLFGLANAGVALDWAQLRETLSSPVSTGIVLGLFLGKPIGIAATSWLAVRTGIAVTPVGVTLRQVCGVAALCGIGFTMSIFISDLAFSGSSVLDSAKISVFVGSALSCIVGMTALYFSTRPASDPSGEQGPDGAVG